MTINGHQWQSMTTNNLFGLGNVAKEFFYVSRLLWPMSYVVQKRCRRYATFPRCVGYWSTIMSSLRDWWFADTTEWQPKLVRLWRMTMNDNWMTTEWQMNFLCLELPSRIGEVPSHCPKLMTLCPKFLSPTPVFLSSFWGVVTHYSKFTSPYQKFIPLFSELLSYSPGFIFHCEDDSSNSSEWPSHYLDDSSNNSDWLSHCSGDPSNSSDWLSHCLGDLSKSSDWPSYCSDDPSDSSGWFSHCTDGFLDTSDWDFICSG